MLTPQQCRGASLTGDAAICWETLAPVSPRHPAVTAEHRQEVNFLLLLRSEAKQEVKEDASGG